MGMRWGGVRDGLERGWRGAVGELGGLVEELGRMWRRIGKVGKAGSVRDVIGELGMMWRPAPLGLLGNGADDDLVGISGVAEVTAEQEALHYYSTLFLLSLYVYADLRTLQILKKYFTQMWITS